MPIASWRELKRGEFYRLSCGCEGVVTHMYKDPEAQPNERGFYMAYSKGLSCKDPRTFENEYKQGYGPYCNFFNYSLCDDAMPAEPLEKPAWWDANPRLREWLNLRLMEN
jgi:hypothetical protein